MKIQLEKHGQEIRWFYEESNFRNAYVAIFSLAVVLVLIGMIKVGQFSPQGLILLLGLAFLLWRSLVPSRNGYARKNDGALEFYTGRPQIRFGFREVAAGLKETIYGERAVRNALIVPFFFPRSKALSWSVLDVENIRVVQYGVLSAMEVSSILNREIVMEGVDYEGLQYLVEELRSMVGVGR